MHRYSQVLCYCFWHYCSQPKVGRGPFMGGSRHDILILFCRGQNATVAPPCTGTCVLRDCFNNGFFFSLCELCVYESSLKSPHDLVMWRWCDVCLSNLQAQALSCIQHYDLTLLTMNLQIHSCQQPPPYVVFFWCCWCNCKTFQINSCLSEYYFWELFQIAEPFLANRPPQQALPEQIEKLQMKVFELWTTLSQLYFSPELF